MNKNINLSKLSKEDLIKVIAIMHDTILDWNNGYGLSESDSDVLMAVGSKCNEVTGHTCSLDGLIEKSEIVPLKKYFASLVDNTHYQIKNIRFLAANVVKATEFAKDIGGELFSIPFTSTVVTYRVNEHDIYFTMEESSSGWTVTNKS